MVIATLLLNYQTRNAHTRNANTGHAKRVAYMQRPAII